MLIPSFGSLDRSSLWEVMKSPMSSRVRAVRMTADRRLLKLFPLTSKLRAILLTITIVNMGTRPGMGKALCNNELGVGGLEHHNLLVVLSLELLHQRVHLRNHIRAAGWWRGRGNVIT